MTPEEAKDLAAQEPLGSRSSISASPSAPECCPAPDLRRRRRHRLPRRADRAGHRCSYGAPVSHRARAGKGTAGTGRRGVYGW
ncbi:hypothetical protein [Streptomyces incanus]